MLQLARYYIPIPVGFLAGLDSRFRRNDGEGCRERACATVVSGRCPAWHHGFAGIVTVRCINRDFT